MARRPGKEIRVSATDALEFEPEPAQKRRVPTTVWLLLALVLITVAGLGGFLFGDRLADIGVEGPQQIPTVHAAEGPIKVRPQNPGGADIPHRGYDINQRMQGELASTRVEKLLPAPEKPLQPPSASAPQLVSAETASAPAPPHEGNADKGAEQLLPAPPPPAPKPRAPAPLPEVAKAAPVAVPRPPVSVAKAPPPVAVPAPPTTTPTTIPAPVAPAPATSTPVTPAQSPSQPSEGTPLKLVPKSQQEPAPAAAPVTKPLEPVSPPVTVTGTRVPPSVRAKVSTPSQTTGSSGWQIQLAASRSDKAARTEGERLKQKHSDVLGKLRVGVVRADLGAKGVFYRIRLGPARDKTEARAICANLSKRGQGCLVVAPGK